LGRCPSEAAAADLDLKTLLGRVCLVKSELRLRAARTAFRSAQVSTNMQQFSEFVTQLHAIAGAPAHTSKKSSSATARLCLIAALSARSLCYFSVHQIVRNAVYFWHGKQD
jgi:hypothetical protein